MPPNQSQALLLSPVIMANAASSALHGYYLAQPLSEATRQNVIIFILQLRRPRQRKGK